jgi:NAD-dependent dihydropyrimidine dehydrogenase PreA subunit
MTILRDGKQQVIRSPSFKISGKEKSVMAFTPTVDEEKCVGCEECVDVCPVEVFEMQDGKSVPVNAEECLGCESCVEVCEESAITVEET